MKPNIELHIEKLVIQGYSRREAHAIGQAIQTELNRLFQTQGIPQNFNQEIHIPKLRLEPMSLPSPSQPKSVGKQIATNVYTGFSSEPSPKTRESKGTATHK